MTPTYHGLIKDICLNGAIGTSEFTIRQEATTGLLIMTEQEDSLTQNPFHTSGGEEGPQPGY